MKIGNEKDFWSGIMFVVVGAGFAIVAQNYDMGTAQRMGPGYFPTWLGALLALIGLYVAIHGLRRASADGKIEKFHFEPLILILVAIILFGALLRPAGLIVALLVMIGVAGYASHEFKMIEIIPLAIFLVLLVLGIFIWGLGLVLPVWPEFMSN